VSRHPRPEAPRRLLVTPLPRWWSSLLAMARSALSWTLSSPTRLRERRLARRRERAELVLRPLLQEATEQLADSLMPELLRAQEQLHQQTELLVTQQQALRVVTELLTVVLDSLQPDPSEEISRLSGPQLLPTSPRSSVS
jgi:hypothetical protein